MKAIKFSINSWIFGKTPIEDIARLAKKMGVDGLDISGEPDSIDIKRVKKALNKHDLMPLCINGNFTEESRVFCHSSADMRRAAVEYGKKCVDMAIELGAKKVLLVPSQVNGKAYFVSKEEDWKNSVESISEVSQYASENGIIILLECVNKYEVTLVRTLFDGIRMAKEIGLNNIKIAADTFHMNLEEDSGIHNALRHAGSQWIGHVHLGDNTREVPGRGCMNWREILMALNDIGYMEAISFEPLPHKLTLEEIFEGALDPEELAGELESSLKFLKAIMQTIK